MMPRMRWVRLWTQETLYGTTNRELSLEERAIWFEMLALAGDSPVPGQICVSPSVSFTDAQLSQIFNAPQDLVRLTVNKLASPEINKISLSPTGLISIVNWTKYQSEFDRTEYQREYMQSYRKRKSNSRKTNGGKSIQQTGTEGKGGEVPKSNPLLKSNIVVVAPPTPPREKATTTATKDTDRYGDTGFASICKTYEAEIGMLTPFIGEQLKALLTDSPNGQTPEQWAGWIAKAINYSASQNKRNLAYIQATLKGWQAQGWQMKPKPKGGPDGKSKQGIEGDHSTSESRALEAFRRAKQRGDL